MDSVRRAVIDRRIAAWERLAADLSRLRDEAKAEAGRLLGPDRGE